MKIKLNTLAVVVALSVNGVAFADDQATINAAETSLADLGSTSVVMGEYKSRIVQEGDYNNANVTQHRDREYSTVVQDGTTLEARVVQQGWGSYSKVNQEGDKNTANVTQGKHGDYTASYNRSLVDQHGSFNRADVEQMGDYNRSVIIQGANSINALAEVAQDGLENDSYILQNDAKGQTATVYQHGDYNDSYVRQIGATTAGGAYVSQTGTYNTAITTQTQF